MARMGERTNRLRHSYRTLSGAGIAALACMCLQTMTSAEPLDPAALKAHVEYLASDDLEGRAAGTRGYDLAARYVARQFEQAGLKPAGDDGTWYQRVPLVEAYAVIPESAVRLEHGATVQELVAKKDYLPRAHFVEQRATLTAGAVFVGYGVDAPRLRYNDFAGVDLHGRIAVLLAGAPPTFAANERAFYSSGSYKYRTLEERGAVAFIMIDTPDDEKRRPWSRDVQQSWMPAMRWHDAAGIAHEAFPGLRGRFLFSREGAEKLFAGAPRSLKQVFARAASGRPQAFELPVTVALASTTTHNRIASDNVIGVLEGSDPQLKSEYVVYSAHLDHVGRGAAVEGDAIYNGALDNASGIAIMIETARALAAMPQRPRRSILFLAATAEERGLLGSDYFARQPTVPALSIVANVNTDMPIAFAPLSDAIAYGAEHSTLGAVARRAARSEGLKLSPDPMPEEVSFVRSDQYSFVRQGIPALDMNTGLKSRSRHVDPRKQLAEFLAQRYHMPGDDTSQPIHYGTLGALGGMNLRIAIEIANETQRPQWLPRDFFGRQFGEKRSAALAAQQARDAATAQGSSAH
jgi:hypothetical protein